MVVSFKLLKGDCIGDYTGKYYKVLRGVLGV